MADMAVSKQLLSRMFAMFTISLKWYLCFVRVCMEFLNSVWFLYNYFDIHLSNDWKTNPLRNRTFANSSPQWVLCWMKMVSYCTKLYTIHRMQTQHSYCTKLYTNITHDANTTFIRNGNEAWISGNVY